MLKTRKILIVLVLLGLVMAAAACGEEDSDDAQDAGAQPSAEASSEPEAEPDAGGEATCYEEGTKTDSGLEITDEVCGDGTVAEAGKLVTVHYVGKLEDGTKFDSSLDRGQPFEFLLGGGMVIQGWDEGIVGMAIGGKRTLVIPPELGYGAEGAGEVIPPDATLIFDVELLEVADGPSS